MRHATVAIVAAVVAASVPASCSDSKPAGYCDVAKQVVGAQTALDEQMNGNTPPAPAQFEAAVTAYLDHVRRLRDIAPATIRHDMDGVLTSFTAFDSAMSKVGYDFRTLMSDPAAAKAAADEMSVMQTTEIKASMDKVDQYTQTTCGFNLDSSN